MKSFLHSSFLFVFLALLACPAPSFAGSSSGSRAGVELYGEEAIRLFAQKVNHTLDDAKVNLAVIGRSGRPRSQLPQGISYTHVAIVVFEPVTTPDGKIGHTYTVYNLYQGDQGRDDRSYLAQDFTYDFVAGSAERDVAVIVPVEALQKRILGVIRSPAYQALHNPQYNLVTNPWVDKYDNCVSHTLKVCVAAIYQTDDRARIYGNIRNYFTPTPVKLSALQSFGSAFMRSVSRDDAEKSGLQTATFGSLKTFFVENGLMKSSFTITMN